MFKLFYERIGGYPVIICLVICLSNVYGGLVVYAGKRNDECISQIKPDDPRYSAPRAVISSFENRQDKPEDCNLTGWEYFKIFASILLVAFFGRLAIRLAPQR